MDDGRTIRSLKFNPRRAKGIRTKRNHLANNGSLGVPLHIDVHRGLLYARMYVTDNGATLYQSTLLPLVQWPS
jgi:hypothetical protein